MSPVDRQRMLAALLLLVMALFVSAGYPPAARWRPQLRIASIVLFFVAVVMALVEIEIWWSGRGP